jgi:hypothetical protein
MSANTEGMRGAKEKKKKEAAQSRACFSVKWIGNRPKSSINFCATFHVRCIVNTSIQERKKKKRFGRYTSDEKKNLSSREMK